MSYVVVVVVVDVVVVVVVVVVAFPGIYWLVGAFKKPFQTYASNWIMDHFPQVSRQKNETYLQPPRRLGCSTTHITVKGTLHFE